VSKQEPKDLYLSLSPSPTGRVHLDLGPRGGLPLQSWLADNLGQALETVVAFLSEHDQLTPDGLCDRLMVCAGKRPRSHS
jgi:hypothetical protein